MGSISTNAGTESKQTATDLSLFPWMLEKVVSPTGLPAFMAGLLFLNYLALFLRPQNNIKLLGDLYIITALSVIPFPFWVWRWRENWTPQTRAMAGLLVFGLVMGPFVRNNFWAFQIWRDIAQSFTCFLFPMVVFLCYGRSLRRLGALCTFIGVYLSIHAALYKGTGPGGFLGDENDNCFAIVAMMAFPLFLYPGAQTLLGKLLYLLSVLIMFFGVVFTDSRGGFLGLLSLGGFYFWRSHQKIPMLIALGLVGIAGALYVPHDYWNEMKGISNTEESTAKARLDIWRIALRVFFDRRNFLTGVGMNNTPYYIGEYETAEDLQQIGRSFGGRQVHSMYVQILSDLGLIGVLIVGSAVIAVFRRNTVYGRLVRRKRARLPEIKNRFRLLAEEIIHGRSSPHGDDRTAEEKIKKTALALRHAPEVLENELRLACALLAATSASLAGALVSAGFISVLYYPPIWFIIAISAAVQIYIERLLRLIDLFEPRPAEADYSSAKPLY